MFFASEKVDAAKLSSGRSVSLGLQITDIKSVDGAIHENMPSQLARGSRILRFATAHVAWHTDG